jgi:guanosine-diphosphatase
MIDAGSTRSRIHVYKFNNCGATPDFEGELAFEMIPKREGGSGLSSYRADTEGAAKSLNTLLDVAMKTIPDKLKACSPIAVKATAGLRKLNQTLGPDASKNILAAVRKRLETQYPFPVVSAESVYAWVTTNYLLGKIGGPDKSPTAAVFDLGGGSTTFKSPSGGMPEKLAEGDHK